MRSQIKAGDCVKTPDGRIGRVRETDGSRVRVRVQRSTSKTHQFLTFSTSELEIVDCPKGWMSPEGYNRYLKITLSKMKARTKK